MGVISFWKPTPRWAWGQKRIAVLCCKISLVVLFSSLESLRFSCRVLSIKSLSWLLWAFWKASRYPLSFSKCIVSINSLYNSFSLHLWRGMPKHCRHKSARTSSFSTKNNTLALLLSTFRILTEVSVVLGYSDWNCSFWISNVSRPPFGCFGPIRIRKPWCRRHNPRHCRLAYRNLYCWYRIKLEWVLWIKGWSASWSNFKGTKIQVFFQWKSNDQHFMEYWKSSLPSIWLCALNLNCLFVLNRTLFYGFVLTLRP